MHATSQFKCHALPLSFHEMQCNAKSLVQQVFCIFPTTSTMPRHHPPASTRHGKGFMKAETTTLLKAIEQILPIDVEAWNEVHDVLSGVEGLKRKFNKLTNKPVPTGNPNMPEDVRLTKSVRSKLFCHSGVTNLSEEEEEEEDIEEEEVDDRQLQCSKRHCINKDMNS